MRTSRAKQSCQRQWCEHHNDNQRNTEKSKLKMWTAKIIYILCVYLSPYCSCATVSSEVVLCFHLSRAVKSAKSTRVVPRKSKSFFTFIICVRFRWSHKKYDFEYATAYYSKQIASTAADLKNIVAIENWIQTRRCKNHIFQQPINITSVQWLESQQINRTNQYVKTYVFVLMKNK